MYRYGLILFNAGLFGLGLLVLLIDFEAIRQDRSLGITALSLSVGLWIAAMTGFFLVARNAPTKQSDVEE